MPYTYFGETGGARIMRYGDVWTQLDTQHVPFIKTWAITPAGEFGDCVFRAVNLKIRHTAGYNITIATFVDGVANRSKLFSGAVPTGADERVQLQCFMRARGAELRAEVTFNSVPGVIEVVDLNADGNVLRAVP